MCSIPLNTFSHPYSINHLLQIDEKHPYPEFLDDVTPQSDIVIFEDTCQAEGHHEQKHRDFASFNVYLQPARLRAGDYAMDKSHVVVDTKRHLDELEQAVAPERNEHDKTKGNAHQWETARELGYQFIILTETDEASSIEDIASWVHPECYKRCPWYDGMLCDPSDGGTWCERYQRNYRPISAERFIQRIHDAERDYGVKFMFCKPEQSAGVIYDLLTNNLD